MIESQCWFQSVLFSHSVVSNSLRLHELQHARLPCPSPAPGAYPNSRPLSRWCHLTISSSVVPFSSCPQSFPASGSFPVSQLFASGGQNIGVSASTSVLPVNTQDWSPLGWTGWISLQSMSPINLNQRASQVALMEKLACQSRRDAGSIPGSERSLGEGNGYPLQYSCLENPMERGVLKPGPVNTTNASGLRLLKDESGQDSCRY